MPLFAQFDASVVVGNAPGCAHAHPDPLVPAEPVVVRIRTHPVQRVGKLRLLPVDVALVAQIDATLPVAHQVVLGVVAEASRLP